MIWHFNGFVFKLKAECIFVFVCGRNRYFDFIIIERQEFIHNLNIKRNYLHTDLTADFCGRSGMYKDFALAAHYAHFVVNALESRFNNSTCKLTVFRRSDFNILGTDYNIDRRVFAKALVNTFKLFAENFYTAVAEHCAVKNICLADKIRNKRIYGFVVNIFR